MASQVLSGTNTNLTYTNNTGQNVRVVINYLKGGLTSTFTMTAGNMSITSLSVNVVIGRNLAFKSNSSSSFTTGNNGFMSEGQGFPTEVMLAPAQVFSVTGNSTYNIVIIPEAG